MRPPSGVVPQTRKRMVAFIRPSSRSGVSPWRKLTWVLLLTDTQNQITRYAKAAAQSSQPRWAMGDQ